MPQQAYQPQSCRGYYLELARSSSQPLEIVDITPENGGLLDGDTQNKEAVAIDLTSQLTTPGRYQYLEVSEDAESDLTEASATLEIPNTPTKSRSTPVNSPDATPNILYPREQALEGGKDDQDDVKVKKKPRVEHKRQMYYSEIPIPDSET